MNAKTKNASLTISETTFAFLSADVKEAVKQDRFSPYFQPIFNLQENTLLGFEVLARRGDLEDDLVSPTLFISAAEVAGVLNSLLASLLRQACRVALQHSGNFMLFFNLSPSQLSDPQLPELIVEAAGSFPLSRINLEITENIEFHELEPVQQVTKKLRSLGLGIILDDFGTGFSSLARLQMLPITGLKIDACFVRSLCEDRQSRKIVSAVIGLGQGLGIPVIAEGIEKEEQVVLLRRMGCHFGQGFLLGRGVMSCDLQDFEVYFESPVQERRFARSTQEQRAAQIETMYRESAIALAFVGADRRFLNLNKAFADRMGSSIHSFVGRDAVLILPYPISAAMQNRVPPGISSANLWEWQGDAKESQWPPDGPVEVEWPEGNIDLIHIDTIWDSEGDWLGYSLMGIDITEKKRMEDALRKAKYEPDLPVAGSSSPLIGSENPCISQNVTATDAVHTL